MRPFSPVFHKPLQPVLLFSCSEFHFVSSVLCCWFMGLVLKRRFHGNSGCRPDGSHPPNHRDCVAGCSQLPTSKASAFFLNETHTHTHNIDLVNEVKLSVAFKPIKAALSRFSCKNVPVFYIKMNYGFNATFPTLRWNS